MLITFAFTVENIDKEIIKLKKKFKLVVKPCTPAIAFANKKVSLFLKMKNGFIIELI